MAFSPSKQHQPAPQVKRPGRQLALLLVTAMVSFALGMTIGRNTAPAPQVVKVKVPLNRGDAGQEKLTFYNTLPKGETPALGSGINRSTPQPPTPTPPPATVATVADAASPAAAKPVAPSTATLPPPKATEKKAAAADDKPSSSWMIQAASYPKEADARTLAKKLQSKGYKARIEATEIKGKTWYRVYVGPYAAEKGARQAAAALARERLSTIVRKQ